MSSNAHATSHAPAERKQRQLFMVRTAQPVEPPPQLPAGYTMRSARESDLDSYAALFRVVFPEASVPFESLMDASLPGGFKVVVDDEDHVRASAAAAIFPKDDHPGGASLQWVMADPDHRSLGLGRIVVQEATRMLADCGQPYAYLSTDDWRLSAISLYLSLGWQPLLYEDDMPRRWSHVFGRLQRTFTPTDWPTTPLATQ